MTKKTQDKFTRLKSGTISGLFKGWKGLTWLLKILVPISFATALLVHFGIIYKLDFLLAPVMELMSLPPSAALVLIIGLFTGIYGAVAALSVMPFSMEHMTLMAIFLLISHNLIQESIVQGKSGINPFVAGIFRLMASFVVTFICAKIMGVTSDVTVAGSTGLIHNPELFTVMFKQWGLGISKLGIKIFFIIMPLMVALELAKEFDLISFVTKLSAPVLSILGLSRSTGMLWLTATIFGLAYGSAVIVEETRTNTFLKEDLTKLHLSIGINHAMIEDPALFLPLGLPAFWLWIPRLIAAMIATYLFHLFSFARSRYAKRTGHKKLCGN